MPRRIVRGVQSDFLRAYLTRVTGLARLASASAASAAIVVTASEGRARATQPPAIEIALRAGYALPAGNLTGDSGGTKGLALGDSFRGQVPLSADLGVRPIPKLYIGGYFSYGFGILPGNSCASGVSCSAHDIRFGLDVSYHALPSRPLDPWIGVGAGYEILGGSESTQGQSASFAFHGVEVGHVQAGLDIKSAGIGPFVMATLSDFSGASVEGNAIPGFSGALHSWVEFGLRGYFDISLGPKYDEDPEDDDAGGSQNFLKPTPAAAQVAAPPPPPPPPVTEALPGPAVVFPPDVQMASRAQCTLVCGSSGTQVEPAESARVEGLLRQHLSALRACSLAADRRHGSPPISVQFDRAGVGRAILHLNQSNESMRACVSRFPAAPPIPGPANAAWSCEDLCN